MQKQNRKDIEIKAIRLDLPKSIHQEIKELAEDEDKSRTLVIIEALLNHLTIKNRGYTQ